MKYVLWWHGQITAYARFVGLKPFTGFGAGVAVGGGEGICWSVGVQNIVGISAQSLSLLLDPALVSVVWQVLQIEGAEHWGEGWRWSTDCCGYAMSLFPHTKRRRACCRRTEGRHKRRIIKKNPDG